MKIFSSNQLKELDAYTIEHEPVASYDLMERAAAAMSKIILERFDKGAHFIVFAGPGNNGGDALAIARLLAERGMKIEAYAFNIGSKMSPECAKNETRLSGMKGVKLTEITQQFEPVMLTDNDVIIDGLFGTGLNKPLAGGFAGLVRYINSQPAYVISIDIPSGLMCDDNSFNVTSNIVRADLTLSVELPKLSFFFADTADYCGEIVSVPINLSKEYINSTATPYTTLNGEEACRILREKNKFAHKGTFGHGLLVAGSYGMAGASVLAGKACLRSGIGKLTVHVPGCNYNILQTALPEAVLSIDSGTHFFTRAENTASYEAVAIGPGLGNFHDSSNAFISQTRGCKAPLVIDADGINILSEHKSWISQLPQKTILTPHPGEFARLAELSGKDCFSALREARDMAMRFQFYVILKGHYTFINTPEGHTYINTSGNAGMATAGSGDVLTGIILALLAQGYSQDEASRLGVYVHGLAGDLAAAKLGQDGMIASDIIENLPDAFLRLRAMKKTLSQSSKK